MILTRLVSFTSGLIGREGRAHLIELSSAGRSPLLNSNSSRASTPPSLLSIWRSCRHHPVHPRPCETSPVSGTWWSTRSAGSRAGSGASGSWRSPRLAPASRLSPNGSRSRLREKDETAGGGHGVATTTTRARARAHCSRCRSWRRHRLAMRLGLEASRFRSEGVLWVQAARARGLTFSRSISEPAESSSCTSFANAPWHPPFTPPPFSTASTPGCRGVYLEPSRRGFCDSEWRPRRRAQAMLARAVDPSVALPSL